MNFTDGTTFTSANVVASLNRVKNPKTADAASSFISTVTKIVPDGTYAVKLLLSHPNASVLNGLTSLNLAMLSTKSIAAGTLSKTPVGTGPLPVRQLGAGQFVHGQRRTRAGGAAR